MGQRILVSGARQVRPVRSPEQLRDCYVAVVAEVDIETGTLEARFEMDPDPSLCSECYSFSCRGMFLAGEAVIGVCLPSEVVFLEREHLGVQGRTTHPLFNDVHGACMLPDGRLAVVSTGLDRVVLMKAGELDSVIPVSRAVTDLEASHDYRAVSTKPHKVHPNHVLGLDDGRILVTRFNQADVYDLRESTTVFDGFEGKPHDGHLWDGLGWYTSVNGFVYGVDMRSMTRVFMVDLGKVIGRRSVGWCRGVCVAGENVCVGMSVIRKTGVAANIRHVLPGSKAASSSAIIVLNRDGELVRELRFDPRELALVFGMMPALGA